MSAAAVLAGERELANMVLQAIAAVLVGALARDAWRWLRRRRSQHQHPAHHRQAASNGQPSHVRVVTPAERVHDWAQDEETS